MREPVEQEEMDSDTESEAESGVHAECKTQTMYICTYTNTAPLGL